MFRGYDSGQVLREEIIERVKYLQKEIATLQKSMNKLKEQTAASEGRIQKLKKELGFTYPAEPFISRNINTTDYYSPVPTLRSSISKFSV